MNLEDAHGIMPPTVSGPELSASLLIVSDSTSAFVECLALSISYVYVYTDIYVLLDVSIASRVGKCVPN